MNTDIDKEVLIATFATNFLIRERRGRSVMELNNLKKRNLFINKLNHSWDNLLDMRKLVRLQKNANDYIFIKDYLKVKDKYPCYVVSNYDDIDDKIFDFQQAFTNSYGRGFATLLIFQDADKLYLETEVDYGQQNRFVGKLV